jgi:nicotinamide-nucleotide amidase
MALRIETLAIGDELLTGRIADTNSAFVGDQLFRKGFRLQRTSAIADDEASIVPTLKECSTRADYVICFGGLGPTSDDKTAEVVARLLGSPLVSHPASLERLTAAMASRNRVLTPQLLKQVVYPEKAQAIGNGVGSAPGFACTLGKARLFFLPGVPLEMKPMFMDSVLPEILRASGPGYLQSQIWKCIGIPESELQRKMDGIERALPPEAWLGYRTRFPENHLTLYWKSLSSERTPEFEKVASVIEKEIAGLFYTKSDLELEELVLEQLRALGMHLALAESCTGGMASHRMTRVPGSSEFFFGGTVVYQVAAKARLLGVELENPTDAVSAQCTLELAKSLQKRSGCAVTAAVTGYMGPTGGTHSDPLGTVYIAVVGKDVVESRFQIYGQSRESNQWGASTLLLNEVRKYLAAQSLSKVVEDGVAKS